jgi:hypothetical protein
MTTSYLVRRVWASHALDQLELAAVRTMNMLVKTTRKFACRVEVRSGDPPALERRRSAAARSLQG